MAHIRAHIRIDNPTAAATFVSKINSEGTTHKYTIENQDGTARVDARSLLGVIYATTDYADHMYCVNDTVDGVFPSLIDDYRVIA